MDSLSMAGVALPVALGRNELNSLRGGISEDMALAVVTTSDKLAKDLHALAASRMLERRDVENSMKRFWIFQHLLDRKCETCSFLPPDLTADPTSALVVFRIRTRCLSAHYNVSVNTPFNWLIRDFARLHAPRSQQVRHRKDLREIYYDPYGLFRPDMQVKHFIELAQKLQGRPTGPQQARAAKRQRSPQSITAALTPPSKFARVSISPGVAGGRLALAAGPHAGQMAHEAEDSGGCDTNATERNSSRLVLMLWVSNLTQVFNFREKLNIELQKGTSPYELPTLRPEFGTVYEVGRKDLAKENEESENPNKIFIEDVRLSRRHLVLSWTAVGWVAEDPGSYSGTTVTTSQMTEVERDGQKLLEEVRVVSKLTASPVVLKEGDVLALADGIATLTVSHMVHETSKRQ